MQEVAKWEVDDIKRELDNSAISKFRLRLKAGGETNAILRL